MAHAVAKGRRLIIHQALHGYADGHRQLANSANLTPRDTKTLLILSDISGPGARLDEHGYLTGFPLTESGMYALARTWPAPEMSRPGCVWTHTLLIDFADLATIKSLSIVNGLFRRPQLSSYVDYGKTTILVEQMAALPLTQTDVVWGRRLMAGLYGKPRSRVVAMRQEGVNVEALVLALWSQQWPRLRRAFRFCTWAAADRSSDSQHFDLQLLPPMDRSIRTRFHDAVDAESLDGGMNSWLDETVLDLIEPDAQGLRSFLHRLGGDVLRGREGFQPLCRLHQLIGVFETDPKALGAAVALLDNQLGPTEARVARAMVASAGITHAHELDHDILEFLIRNIDLVDLTSLEEGADNFGREIWKQDPTRLLSLLEGNDSHRIIPERTFAGLQLDELLNGLQRSVSLIKPVLERRPEVMAQPAFWAIDGLDSEVALSSVSSLKELQLPVLEAIVTAGRHDLAPHCVRLFGSFAVMRVIAPQIDLDSGKKFAHWIRESTYDRYTVAEFLVSNIPFSRMFLIELARILDPDAVPNEYGADPWWLAMDHATGSVAADDLIFLSGYLFCRALGRVSRNVADLARLSFETTHRAVACNRFPYDLWQSLEKRLPMTFLWFDWDRCPRLRSAVVDLFVDRGLAPEVFAHLVDDDHLFFELAKQSCRTSRSRRFLEKVCRVLENEPDDRSFHRISYIQQLLKN